MDVLITGAHGQVGTAIAERLSEKPAYDFTYLDREDLPERETTVADVADYDAIRPAFDGMDAVVHLAAAPRPDLPWNEILESSIIGTYNVMEAVRDAGVEQVVFASSHHVSGNYEIKNAPELYGAHLDFKIDHTDPVRPDSYYAIAKLFGEHAGNHYVENMDAPEQFYALRLCNVSNEAYDDPYGRAEEAVEQGEYERDSPEYEQRVARRRAMWCSRRDVAQLVERCLQDETVDFDVFYGVSDNPARWFDISHARNVLGYEPQDDASEWTERPERYEA
ncbi:NAD(P)-dependent oxidoreductase [Natronomonas sp. F2-12]|jgi:nucleoside-diphosphate-sugar epimerase|uniref:NAD(P)-dependent oxidoreductase n=1 Tax=Natronomonas aquatica TaxID=2841590 RepID=A0A9R1CTL4_9EURY|nr:NAD(P)-dependent oxidoreductase [Natronomonas aquatica]MCQ4333750.1 NAD(P)-dependent oxidoreductase [Natronomonas aquatica]